MNKNGVTQTDRQSPSIKLLPFVHWKAIRPPFSLFALILHSSANKQVADFQTQQTRNTKSRMVR
ncbi:hypothetical protein H8959_011023 [Pygathrix nigripes]